MDLTKKKGLILRRVYLLPRKRFLGKEEPLNFTEIVEFICRQEDLSFGFTKRVIMQMIKEGFIVFDYRSKERKTYYHINKKEIINELKKDPIYQMDEEIKEDQHNIIV